MSVCCFAAWIILEREINKKKKKLAVGLIAALASSVNIFASHGLRKNDSSVISVARFKIHRADNVYLSKPLPLAVSLI